MVEHRRSFWLLSAALLTFVALLLAPAGARAQSEDGVTVDPNSPSGKEYDIPTERARRDAGGSKKKSEKKDKAPLFGEGVGKEPTATPTPTATASPTATATSTTSAAEAAKKAKARKEAARRKKAREAARRKKAREAEERKQDAAAAAASTPSPSPSPAPVTDVARVSDTDTGGSSWALIGGIVVALVVVGTTGGLLLRRRFS